MPEAEHIVEVRAPQSKVWEFVSNMDKWAPLVPGYVSHEKKGEKESLWTLKGDVGILTKKVTFQINITEWTEPSKVAFTMKGVNENVSGKGYFQGETVTLATTKVTGHLELQQGGSMGPMVNSLFKVVMPKVTKSFVETMAKSIEESAK